MSEIEFSGGNLSALTLSYYTGAFVSFFLGFAGAIYLFKRSPVEAVSIAFCCFFSNTILLGLPVTERAYGADALADNWAIIAFHVPICYFLGLSAMEILKNDWSNWRVGVSNVLNSIVRNSFFIAIVLGLLVSFLGLKLPNPLTEALDLVAVTALPVALFGLGGTLSQYRAEGDKWAILMVCAISLLVHPTIVILMGQSLNLDQDALRSAVVTASMAPGINAYIFAGMYNAAPRLVASSVLVATAASMLTASFWLLVLG